MSHINDVFLDVLDIPDIQGEGGGREGARERRDRREGGRGKTGENRRKRAKTRGKRAGNKKGGKGKRKEGETSLKMIILEGKLSQNRVREGIWEGGREFGCLSRRRRPKKNIIDDNHDNKVWSVSVANDDEIPCADATSPSCAATILSGSIVIENKFWKL